MVPFNNLMSRLLANVLNFNSIFSYFVTAFIFSILFNLFILSILSSSIFLFVVSFIDSILILYHSILLSFLFCLFLFLLLVLLINFIPTPFFHSVFFNFLNCGFISLSDFVSSSFSDYIYFMLSLSIITCCFIF